WPGTSLNRTLWGTSRAVRTHRTPGTASAAAVSIRTSRADGREARTIFAWSMPPIAKSSAYRVRPKTLSVASGRGARWPTIRKPPALRDVDATSRPLVMRAPSLRVGTRPTPPRLAGSRMLRGAARVDQAASGSEGRIHDLVVPGAAAEVAADRFANLLARRLGVETERRIERH